MSNELASALETLKAHGLVGRVMAGAIIAGTGFKEGGDGIHVFENVFSISELQDGWAFQPGGPMNHETERRLETLQQAVASALAWTASCAAE